ncbi:MAG: hypothetical protein D3925_13145 [Candidatus Electrothrix sp. AR5]|nr:hypothetical protein [Candidatus Electrothrix sp. AR5]
MAAPAVLRKFLRGTFAELLFADMVFSGFCCGSSFFCSAGDHNKSGSLTLVISARKIVFSLVQQWAKEPVYCGQQLEKID